MSIAGTSHATLSRYSHVRMDAKRRTLGEFAPRRPGRRREAERMEHVPAFLQAAMVQ